MLKGIRGVANQDVHLVPVIRNTPRERELVEQLDGACSSDPRFATAFAVLVADHGAYIWGDDVWEAKRHAEVYHFLFEATVARRDRHAAGGAHPMTGTTATHEHEHFLCPTCSRRCR